MIERMGREFETRDMSQEDREALCLKEIKRRRAREVAETGEQPALLVSAGVAPVACKVCNRANLPNENVPHVMIPLDGDTRILTVCGWCIGKMERALNDIIRQSLGDQLGGVMEALRELLGPPKRTLADMDDEALTPENVKPFPGKAPKWEM